MIFEWTIIKKKKKYKQAKVDHYVNKYIFTY